MSDFEFIFETEQPNYEDFKVSRDLMENMTRAVSICNKLGEDCISSLDFIIATLVYGDTILFDYVGKGENNPKNLECVEQFFDEILLNKDIYQKLIGKNYDEFLKIKNKPEIKIKDLEKYNKDKKSDIFSFCDNFYLVNSEELENAFIRAKNLCAKNNRDYIDSDLLTYCIFENQSSSARKFMRMLFSTKGLSSYLKKNINLDTIDDRGDVPEELSDYLIDLKCKYSKKSNSDIKGRDDEIFKLWNIISKKTKRNAVLVGEPGVGKTAIIEAITYSIINKKCPKQFNKYKIYMLDINSMVAGTEYRGQFEERVKYFIDYIQNSKDTIVFIDEIHHLLGAGNAEDSGPDLAGALKPILSRDNIIVIGATTNDEYERIFSKDGALSRRFETVFVEEPKYDKVKEMIEGRIETLSKYHEVAIDDKMVDKVMIFANSFSDVANPDRTIDLLDKSMAMAKIFGDNQVKYEHLFKVYKKEFDKYNKIPEEERKGTAYHEAGHFVAWLLSKTKANQKCTSVSIVPAYYWAGVTMFEDIDEITQKDENFLKESIIIDLAGRIAESFVTKGVINARSIY